MRVARRFGRVVVVMAAGLGAAPGGAAGAGAAGGGGQAPEPVTLWPEGAPGAAGKEPADVPTLSVYRPAHAAAPTAAVVICPGGGYGGLADHEGRPVAEWLNKLGVTGVVLKYRLGPRYKHPAMLNDAARAVRTVRARAAEWNLDPKRVGILGFSAGGHLAATASTRFDAGKADALDAVERLSGRPDLSILLYPVITLTEPHLHRGSRQNLLGKDHPQELAEKMSAEKNVTKDTPPAFLFHTVADGPVPVENSLLYAAALRKAGVPFEMHLYERGGHGVGLAQGDAALKSWPDLCAAWLRVHGFVTQPPPAQANAGGPGAK